MQHASRHMHHLLLHPVQAFKSQRIEIVAAEQFSMCIFQQLIMYFIHVIDQAPDFASFPVDIFPLHFPDLAQDEIRILAGCRNGYRYMQITHDIYV